MKDIRAIHRKAIDLAKIANECLEKQDFKEYLRLTAEALELEKEAAEMLFANKTAEPTRSVLYRSAATLAFNCGKFEEAKMLAYSALTGNPYPEIRIELENLLISINESVLSRVTIEDSAEMAYLNLLRTKAVYLKIEPKSLKHSKKAVVIEYIIDFLKTIQVSYNNYSRVSFSKEFVPNETEDHSGMLNNFLKQSKPMAVDLGFNSFGISIVADNEIMFDPEFYSPKFINWKNDLFDDFKNEVILPDYTSPEFLQNIQHKYTAEERAKIFSPIIDSTKESTPYNIYLTNNGFTEKLRKYTQPESTIKQILVPKQPTVNEESKKILTRKLELVSSTGKGKRQTLMTETLENMDLRITVDQFTVKEKELVLKEGGYTFKITYNRGEWIIDDIILKIYCISDDYDKTIKEYDTKVIALYDKLLQTRNYNEDERVTLAKFEEIVFSRNW